MRDLIRNSPVLQHQYELFAIGLIDNPCSPCDLAERRKLCEGYAHKWSHTINMMKSTLKLPPGQSLGWGTVRYLGSGYFASDFVERNSLTLLYIPPVASQKSVKCWSIPPLTFQVFCCAVHPPENVLVITEQEGK